jgi:hypothetical protein
LAVRIHNTRRDLIHSHRLDLIHKLG